MSYSNKVTEMCMKVADTAAKLSQTAELAARAKSGSTFFQPDSSKNGVVFLLQEIQKGAQSMVASLKGATNPPQAIQKSP